MVKIEFVDKDGEPTLDMVEGWPSVNVLLEVGFEPPADQDAKVFPKFRRYRAILDTGANVSIVDVSLVKAGLVPLQKVAARNLGVQRAGEVHRALLQIEGLGPIMLPMVAQPILMQNGIQMPVILGRDVLSRYRMVYDCGKGECTID